MGETHYTETVELNQIETLDTLTVRYDSRYSSGRVTKEDETVESVSESASGVITVRTDTLRLRYLPHTGNTVVESESSRRRLDTGEEPVRVMRPVEYEDDDSGVSVEDAIALLTEDDSEEPVEEDSEEEPDFDYETSDMAQLPDFDEYLADAIAEDAESEPVEEIEDDSEDDDGRLPDFEEWVSERSEDDSEELVADGGAEPVSIRDLDSIRAGGAYREWIDAALPEESDLSDRRSTVYDIRTLAEACELVLACDRVLDGLDGSESSRSVDALRKVRGSAVEARDGLRACTEGVIGRDPLSDFPELLDDSTEVEDDSEEEEVEDDSQGHAQRVAAQLALAEYEDGEPITDGGRDAAPFDGLSAALDRLSVSVSPGATLVREGEELEVEVLTIKPVDHDLRSEVPYAKEMDQAGLVRVARFEALDKPLTGLLGETPEGDVCELRIRDGTLLTIPVEVPSFPPVEVEETSEDDDSGSFQSGREVRDGEPITDGGIVIAEDDGELLESDGGHSGMSYRERVSGRQADLIDRLSDDGSLTEKQAVAWVLREVEGLSREEVASIMDMSASTVDTHRTRGAVKVAESVETVEALREREEESREVRTDGGEDLGDRLERERVGVSGDPVPDREYGDGPEDLTPDVAPREERRSVIPVAEERHEVLDSTADLCHDAIDFGGVDPAQVVSALREVEEEIAEREGAELAPTGPAPESLLCELVEDTEGDL